MMESGTKVINIVFFLYPDKNTSRSTYKIHKKKETNLTHKFYIYEAIEQQTTNPSAVLPRDYDVNLS